MSFSYGDSIPGFLTPPSYTITGHVLEDSGTLTLLSKVPSFTLSQSEKVIYVLPNYGNGAKNNSKPTAKEIATAIVITDSRIINLSAIKQGKAANSGEYTEFFLVDVLGTAYEPAKGFFGKDALIFSLKRQSDVAIQYLSAETRQWLLDSFDEYLAERARQNFSNQNFGTNKTRNSNQTPSNSVKNSSILNSPRTASTSANSASTGDTPYSGFDPNPGANEETFLSSTRVQVVNSYGIDATVESIDANDPSTLLLHVGLHKLSPDAVLSKLRLPIITSIARSFADYPESTNRSLDFTDNSSGDSSSDNGEVFVPSITNISDLEANDCTLKHPSHSLISVASYLDQQVNGTCTSPAKTTIPRSDSFFSSLKDASIVIELFINASLSPKFSEDRIISLGDQENDIAPSVRLLQRKTERLRLAIPGEQLFETVKSVVSVSHASSKTDKTVCKRSFSQQALDFSVPFVFSSGNNPNHTEMELSFTVYAVADMITPAGLPLCKSVTKSLGSRKIDFSLVKQTPFVELQLLAAQHGSTFNTSPASFNPTARNSTTPLSPVAKQQDGLFSSEEMEIWKELLQSSQDATLVWRLFLWSTFWLADHTSFVVLRRVVRRMLRSKQKENKIKRKIAEKKNNTKTSPIPAVLPFSFVFLKYAQIVKRMQNTTSASDTDSPRSMSSKASLSSKINQAAYREASSTNHLWLWISNVAMLPPGASPLLLRLPPTEDIESQSDPSYFDTTTSGSDSQSQSDSEMPASDESEDSETEDFRKHDRANPHPKAALARMKSKVKSKKQTAAKLDIQSKTPEVVAVDATEDQASSSGTGSGSDKDLSVSDDVSDSSKVAETVTEAQVEEVEVETVNEPIDTPAVEDATIETASEDADVSVPVVEVAQADTVSAVPSEDEDKDVTVTTNTVDEESSQSVKNKEVEDVDVDGVKEEGDASSDSTAVTIDSRSFDTETPLESELGTKVETETDTEPVVEEPLLDESIPSDLVEPVSDINDNAVETTMQKSDEEPAEVVASETQNTNESISRKPSQDDSSVQIEEEPVADVKHTEVTTSTEVEEETETFSAPITTTVPSIEIGEIDDNESDIKPTVETETNGDNDDNDIDIDDDGNESSDLDEEGLALKQKFMNMSSTNQADFFSPAAQTQASHYTPAQSPRSTPMLEPVSTSKGTVLGADSAATMLVQKEMLTSLSDSSLPSNSEKRTKTGLSPTPLNELGQFTHSKSDSLVVEVIWQWERFSSSKGWVSPTSSTDPPPCSRQFTGPNFEPCELRTDAVSLPSMLWKWTEDDWSVVVDTPFVTMMEDKLRDATTKRTEQLAAAEAQYHIDPEDDDNSHSKKSKKSKKSSTSTSTSTSTEKIGIVGKGTLVRRQGKTSEVSPSSMVSSTSSTSSSTVLSPMTQAARNVTPIAINRTIQTEVGRYLGYEKSLDGSLLLSDSLTWRYSRSLKEGFHYGMQTTDLYRVRAWTRSRYYTGPHNPACDCEFCSLMHYVSSKRYDEAKAEQTRSASNSSSSIVDKNDKKDKKDKKRAKANESFISVSLPICVVDLQTPPLDDLSVLLWSCVDYIRSTLPNLPTLPIDLLDKDVSFSLNPPRHDPNGSDLAPQDSNSNGPVSLRVFDRFNVPDVKSASVSEQLNNLSLVVKAVSTPVVSLGSPTQPLAKILQIWSPAAWKSVDSHVTLNQTARRLDQVNWFTIEKKLETIRCILSYLTKNIAIITDHCKKSVLLSMRDTTTTNFSAKDAAQLERTYARKEALRLQRLDSALNLVKSGPGASYDSSASSGLAASAVPVSLDAGGVGAVGDDEDSWGYRVLKFYRDNATIPTHILEFFLSYYSLQQCIASHSYVFLYRYLAQLSPSKMEHSIQRAERLPPSTLSFEALCRNETTRGSMDQMNDMSQDGMVTQARGYARLASKILHSISHENEVFLNKYVDSGADTPTTSSRDRQNSVSRPVSIVYRTSLTPYQWSCEDALHSIRARFAEIYCLSYDFGFHPFASRAPSRPFTTPLLPPATPDFVGKAVHQRHTAMYLDAMQKLTASIRKNEDEQDAHTSMASALGVQAGQSPAEMANALAARSLYPPPRETLGNPGIWGILEEYPRRYIWLTKTIPLAQQAEKFKIFPKSTALVHSVYHAFLLVSASHILAVMSFYAPQPPAYVSSLQYKPEKPFENPTNIVASAASAVTSAASLVSNRARARQLTMQCHALYWNLTPFFMHPLEGTLRASVSFRSLSQRLMASGRWPTHLPPPTPDPIDINALYGALKSTMESVKVLSTSKALKTLNGGLLPIAKSRLPLPSLHPDAVRLLLFNASPLDFMIKQFPVLPADLPLHRTFWLVRRDTMLNLMMQLRESLAGETSFVPIHYIPANSIKLGQAYSAAMESSETQPSDLTEADNITRLYTKKVYETIPLLTQHITSVARQLPPPTLQAPVLKPGLSAIEMSPDSPIFPMLRLSFDETVHFLRAPQSHVASLPPPESLSSLQKILLVLKNDLKMGSSVLSHHAPSVAGLVFDSLFAIDAYATHLYHLLLSPHSTPPSFPPLGPFLQPALQNGMFSYSSPHAMDRAKFLFQLAATPSAPIASPSASASNASNEIPVAVPSTFSSSTAALGSKITSFFSKDKNKEKEEAAASVSIHAFNTTPSNVKSGKLNVTSSSSSQLAAPRYSVPVNLVTLLNTPLNVTLIGENVAVHAAMHTTLLAQAANRVSEGPTILHDYATLGSLAPIIASSIIALPTVAHLLKENPTPCHRSGTSNFDTPISAPKPSTPPSKASSLFNLLEQKFEAVSSTLISNDSSNAQEKLDSFFNFYHLTAAIPPSQALAVNPVSVGEIGPFSTALILARTAQDAASQLSSVIQFGFSLLDGEDMFLMALNKLPNGVYTTGAQMGPMGMADDGDDYFDGFSSPSERFEALCDNISSQLSQIASLSLRSLCLALLPRISAASALAGQRIAALYGIDKESWPVFVGKEVFERIAPVPVPEFIPEEIPKAIPSHTNSRKQSNVQDTVDSYSESDVVIVNAPAAIDMSMYITDHFSPDSENLNTKDITFGDGVMVNGELSDSDDGSDSSDFEMFEVSGDEAVEDDEAATPVSEKNPFEDLYSAEQDADLEEPELDQEYLEPEQEREEEQDEDSSNPFDALMKRNDESAMLSSPPPASSATTTGAQSQPQQSSSNGMGSVKSDASSNPFDDIFILSPIADEYATSPKPQVVPKNQISKPSESVSPFDDLESLDTLDSLQLTSGQSSMRSKRAGTISIARNQVSTDSSWTSNNVAKQPELEAAPSEYLKMVVAVLVSDAVDLRSKQIQAVTSQFESHVVRARPRGATMEVSINLNDFDLDDDDSETSRQLAAENEAYMDDLCGVNAADPLSYLLACLHLTPGSTLARTFSSVFTLEILLPSIFAGLATHRPLNCSAPAPTLPVNVSSTDAVSLEFVSFEYSVEVDSIEYASDLPKPSEHITKLSPADLGNTTSAAADASSLTYHGVALPSVFLPAVQKVIPECVRVQGLAEGLLSGLSPVLRQIVLDLQATLTLAPMLLSGDPDSVPGTLLPANNDLEAHPELTKIMERTVLRLQKEMNKPIRRICTAISLTPWLEAVVSKRQLDWNKDLTNLDGSSESNMSHVDQSNMSMVMDQQCVDVFTIFGKLGCSPMLIEWLLRAMSVGIELSETMANHYAAFCAIKKYATKPMFHDL